MNKVQEFLDSFQTMDEHGFEFRKERYWEPESIEEKIARLESNQLLYLTTVQYGKIYPDEVKKARHKEFFELRSLRNRA
jgi:hypothetical protein